MLNNEVENYRESTFDSIKHIDELGNEYWEARELQAISEYAKWNRFLNMINKVLSSLKIDKSKKEDLVPTKYGK